MGLLHPSTPVGRLSYCNCTAKETTFNALRAVGRKTRSSVCTAQKGESSNERHAERDKLRGTGITSLAGERATRSGNIPKVGREEWIREQCMLEQDSAIVGNEWWMGNDSR
jgi:hypothetical protein